MHGMWANLTVDASEMRCYSTTPDCKERFQALSSGCRPRGWTASFRDRLAEAGFASIAPDLCHHQTEPSGGGGRRRVAAPARTGSRRTWCSRGATRARGAGGSRSPARPPAAPGCLGSGLARARGARV